MVQLRGRSVPAEPVKRTTTKTPGKPTKKMNPALPLAQPSLVPSVSRHNSNTLCIEQVDALARITHELKLRALNTKADQLEREVAELVVRTATDREYKKDNEKRLEKMMVEIYDLRTQLASVQASNDSVRVSVEELQANMDTVAQQIRNEVQGDISEIKSLYHGMDEILSGVGLDGDDGPSNPDDSGSHGMVTRSQLRAQGDSTAQDKPPSTPAAIKSRIQEAINSTRRWNRDYKTTTLPDAQFAANYFKKQSHRDPRLAVLLQRALQRRLRQRTLTKATKCSWSSPRSLEELLQDVKWRDVTDTVKDVLVMQTQRTARVLNEV